ncbi:helix-turn-helix domain-containing protein [Paenibacillus algorifonticola]|uniref:AraC family transcriptional regulator n=1 Tax=Paenibacillus algorifonticola TaxID=684063 RepID=UPI003D2B20D9
MNETEQSNPNQWLAKWESTQPLTDKWVTAGEVHYIPLHTFILVTDGQAIWNMNGEKVHVAFGHLIAIEENSLIEIVDGGNRDLSGWKIQFHTYSLYHKKREILKFEWHVPAGNTYQITQLTGGALASICYHLSEDASRDGNEAWVGNQHFIYGLLKHLYQKQPSDSQTTEQGMQRSIVYMQEHYDEIITRKQLAEMAGISQWHYSRKFSERYGKPPLEYLANYRVYRAQEELLLTSAKAHEIAKKVGFEDAHYFSRRFKQLAGVPPRYYAQTVKQRKIVSLSPLYAEVLVALGVIPHAVVVTPLLLPQHQRQLFAAHQVKLLEVPQNGFDLEIIQQAQPELMVGRYLTEDMKQQLRTIAPVITGLTVDIGILIDQFAAIFNKQTEAAICHNQMNNEVVAARNQLQSIIQSGATVMVLRVEAFGYRYLGGSSTGASQLLYEKLGLSIPELLKSGKAWFNPCTLDELHSANPDFLFVEKRVMEHYSADENMSKLIESSRWSTMKAVKNNRVCYVDTNLWVDGFGYTGQTLVLKQIVGHLLDERNVRAQ